MVVFSGNEKYMTENGLTFEILNELETLGVIKLNTVSGYVATNMSERKVLVYINGKIIETSSHNNNQFPIGNVIFTSSGEALSNITDISEIEGYEEKIRTYLAVSGVSVVEESSYSITLLDGEVKVKRNGK